jgi:hypothetical protein
MIPQQFIKKFSEAFGDDAPMPIAFFRAYISINRLNNHTIRGCAFRGIGSSKQ